MDKKKEILEKIYKNKFESEEQLRKYECDKKHNLGAIDELTNNLVFCDELIEILLCERI